MVAGGSRGDGLRVGELLQTSAVLYTMIRLIKRVVLRKPYNEATLQGSI
ncbi:hypothetical protein QFZ41_003235 [Luteibacter sp. W1I16]